MDYNELRAEVAGLRAVMQTEIRAEIGSLRAEMNARFDKVDRRFDQVDAELRYFYGAMGKLDRRIEAIEKR